MKQFFCIINISNTVDYYTRVEVFAIYSLIIVDDEEWSRLSIKKYVEALCPDFEVSALLSSGSQAIDYLKENKVDVVITDVRMNNTDGLELAEYIQTNAPGIKVIIISGYSEFEYVKRAIKYNVQDYLTKIVNPKEFSEVMDRVKCRLDSENEIKHEYDKRLEINLFFYDLLGGFFSSREEAEGEYNKLGFERSFDECTCEMLKFKFLNFEEYKKSIWKHNESALKNAITNIIDFVFEGTISLPIEIDMDSCNAILFYVRWSETRPISDLVDALNEELQLEAVIEETAGYTLDQIYQGDLADENSRIKNQILSEEESESTENGITASVIKYINKNYSQPLTREDISKEFHMHEMYLARIFKKNTGKTLLEYVTEVRMKQAIELLATDISTEGISVKVGYGSSRTFRRVFKRYTGYSVSEYKKIVLQREGG